MICKKCGAPLKPGASFCGKCGTKQDLNNNSNIPPINNNRGNTPPNNKRYTPPNSDNSGNYAGNGTGYNNNSSAFGGYAKPVPLVNKGNEFLSGNKNKKIGIFVCLGVAVIVLIIIILIISMLFGGRYKGIFEDSFKAIKKEDAEIYLDLVPKEAKEVYIDEFSSERKALKEFEERLKSNNKTLKKAYGDDWKISFKYKDVDKYDKDEIEDYRDENSYWLKKLDMDEDKISAVYEVEIRLEIKGEDDEEHETNDYTFIKYKGKWYSEEILEELYYNI